MEAAIAVAARSADAATQSADAAKKSAEVAERTLVHSERPWIAIYPEIVGELIFDTETVDTIIKITIKNVGNSPAMNVSYNHKMFVNITDAIMYARIEAEKVHTLWAGFGRVLFPQEEFSENWFVSISREEFLESVAKYVAENRLPSPAFGVFAYYTFPAAPDGFRHTTLLVEMRQKDRTFAGFDGSERGFDPKALELAQTITGGEVS
jgi:hypothetical protein